jgi:hypothetical protein
MLADSMMVSLLAGMKKDANMRLFFMLCPFLKPMSLGITSSYNGIMGHLSFTIHLRIQMLPPCMSLVELS